MGIYNVGKYYENQKGEKKKNQIYTEITILVQWNNYYYTLKFFYNYIV